VTWRLSRALDRYVEAHSLGQLWPAEAGFDLTRPGEAQQTVLAPDIAFVRAARVPPPVEGFAHVVPDLVVETGCGYAHRAIRRKIRERPGHCRNGI
jgi:Uma2 family endonuclease